MSDAIPSVGEEVVWIHPMDDSIHTDTVKSVVVDEDGSVRVITDSTGGIPLAWLKDYGIDSSDASAILAGHAIRLVGQVREQQQKAEFYYRLVMLFALFLALNAAFMFYVMWGGL